MSKKKGKSQLVLDGGFQVIGRNETQEIVKNIKEYWGDTNYVKAFQGVFGLPGAGKSVMVRGVCNEIWKDKANENVFIAYVDISDCADEIEVYYRLARELKIYFESNPQNKKSEKAIEQFLTIYQWIYGGGRQYASKAENPLNSGELIFNLIKRSAVKLLENEGALDKISDKIESLNLVYNVLVQLTDVISLTNAAIAIGSVFVETREEQQMKQLMQETVEAFSLKSQREELLRNLLLVGMTGREAGQFGEIGDVCYKPVIILDNFQLSATNDLKRDQTWLSRPGKLMSSINAMWIVVSRMSPTGQFQQLFSKNERGRIYADINLAGFDEVTARTYLLENCPRHDREETTQTEEQESYEQIIERMLQVCRVEARENGFEVRQKADNFTYLPYLLRLVVLHYRKLARDPSCKIKPESFAKLPNQEDFFGYYFYMDLSDLMINAYQILSCLSKWDPLWIDVVRERFDNHLLHATNVLINNAPMEKAGEDGFKLHEAIKDGLYRNSQNYIKQDVLEYLFDKFLKIYGGEEARKNKIIWYEANRLQSFMEIVYSYIEEREVNKKGPLERIKPVISKIYSTNKERGSVTDAFIRFYSQYIDKLKEIYNIPFVKVYEIDLEDLEERKREITNSFRKERKEPLGLNEILYYMSCCFNLGDLYTNISQTDQAVGLEKLCLHFWECMMKEIADNEKEQSIEYFQCGQQKVKALNAIAYDSSAEHQYEEAYHYGALGMNEFEKLADELLERLSRDDGLDQEEMSTLQTVIRPDNDPKFMINSCTEMSQELYERLVAVYKKMLHMEKNKELLCIIFSRLILVDQQNLRGNYPWYCLKWEGAEKKDIWKFGARTYWMRKARLQAADESGEINTHRNYMTTMLRSYHNVCVYLYKSQKLELACVLEKEVLDQSQRMLKSRRELDSLAQGRLAYMRERKDAKEGNLWAYLWKEQKFSGEEEQKKFFEQEELILEEMQYQGDYYLHLGFYALAVTQFATVMLWRVVCLGERDSKTLDTVIRLFVTVFMQENKKLSDYMEQYVEDRMKNRIQLEEPGEAQERDQDRKSRNVKDKYNSLRSVWMLSKDTRLSRTERVKRLLAEIED